MCGVPAKLRLADLLGGLSMVADLGFGLPPGTAVRSCPVAAALARRMNLNDGDVRDSFYTALLMHVGCVGVAHEAAMAFGDDPALYRAVARTNLADPQDMVLTFLPELTRGMSPVDAARARSFALLHGADGKDRPATKPSPVETAFTAAVEEFPDLAHYADKPERAVTLAAALRAEPETERPRRVENLRKSIAAQQRRAQRRLGELLAVAELDKGGRPALDENRSQPVTGLPPALADTDPSVEDIPPHSAPDLHVYNAQSHTA